MQKEMNKKGQLGGAFSNTIVVMVIGILMIVTIYVFTQLGSTFTAGTSAANASTSLTTQFSNQIPLVGVLVAIVFIAAIIALIVGSFMGRGRA